MTALSSGNSLAFLLSDDARLYRKAFEKTVSENGFGLTPGEVRTLAQTLRNPGLRQAVLAERMGIEPMTLSAYLDRLESRNLIERETDKNDRRAKIVQPTEQAHTVLQQLAPLFQRVYDEATRGVSPEMMQSCVKVLMTIRQNLANDPDVLGSLEPSETAPQPMTGRPQW
ncbi:MarR family transcriptional regulator [Aureimonas fodinaquatilis]|uniref:MarR family transcriptional regulator n=1 Tax=Aureimonas fodinaquatilis TaxID=2565783 RepID=A0A5B0DTF4_9HYPH|nr:MarR family transcriptional regulator [Aureimonas fodinaquatilis]KAA0969698.1 MarR family transcriptional regulator [Aureimonas fodinaquatilis]